MRLIYLIVILCVLIPCAVNASSNITLTTNVTSGNTTILLFTNVTQEQLPYSGWSGSGGCGGCGGGGTVSVTPSTPISWLAMFPNMITGLVNQSSICNDIRIMILSVEPTSVNVGSPVTVTFVAESDCRYVGNINLLLNGSNNRTLGIDLKDLYNKTYTTSIETSSLQPGVQNFSILNAYSSFNVAGNVIPTNIPVINYPQYPIASGNNTGGQSMVVWGGVVGIFVILTIIAFIL